MKLDKLTRSYLNKFSTVAEILGVSVSVDLRTKHSSDKTSLEYKAKYYFGRPNTIIVYLGRIDSPAELIECTIHELVHHIQFLRGLFPKFFNTKKNPSQVRVEDHARKLTDKILKSLFDIRGHKMDKEARKEYSK